MKISRIINNKVEALEFLVSENSALIGTQIQNLKIKKNNLLGTIMRDNHVIIPKGSDVLEENDRVVVVTTTERLLTLDDILE